MEASGDHKKPRSGELKSPVIQAIAFDLDDTLISRISAIQHLLANWLKEVVNAPSTLLDDVLARDGGGNSNRNDFFDYLAQLGIAPGDRLGIRIRFTRELPMFFRPDSAVVALLNRLRNRGFELAVLTNGGAEMQRAKLDKSGLTELFEEDRILISEEIYFEKPATEAFTILSERLNTPPANTLFVGDHPSNDVDGARAAGFQTCWISAADLCESESPRCDFQIAGIGELETTCLE